MARQPYLPTFAHLNFAVGALVLKDHPTHCAAIGKCVAIWGQVDNEMGNLFGLLLGTNSVAALEVFLSLRRLSNQREALRAAAKHTLSSENLSVFEALLARYKSLEAERNCLAHGCFGVSDDDPTVLYWIDIKDHVHYQVEVLSSQNVSADTHARLKQNMYVYRPSDLETLYDEMEELWWAVFRFNGYLRDPTRVGEIQEIRRLIRWSPKSSNQR